MKIVKFEDFNFILGKKLEILNFILAKIKEEKGFILLPTSLNDFASVDNNIKLKRSYRNIDFCVTDGMPLVWFFNFKTLFKNEKNCAERVYGPDLMRDILKSGDKKLKHFFYGSSEKTIKNLRRNVLKISPEINIVGMVSPPFRELTPEEEGRYIAGIKKSRANVLWIGLSSPKQVIIASSWYHFLPNVSILCVGASLDFLAGEVAQAPIFLQKFGFEWLFRLMFSPMRLWNRYLVIIPRFLLRKAYFLLFN